jgi:predicted nucleic-acid-binding Zn-ribbon protein
MKDGKCPKCSSGYIRVKKSNIGEYADSGGWFRYIPLNTVPIGAKSGFFADKALFAEVDNYVCLNCGYLESYIANQEHLDFIAQNWEAVTEKPVEPK